MLQQEISFTLIGVSPLVMNNPMSMFGEDTGGTRKEYPPDKEAEIRTYRTAEGYLCIPVTWARSSCLKAASGQKAKPPHGKGMAVALRGLIAGGFFDPDDTETFTLLGPDGNPITDYEIYTTTAIVNKARILRHRPMIKDWMVHCHYTYFPEVVNDKNIEACLYEAGMRCGIGDQRPSSPKSPGKYGRFKVIDFQVKEIAKAA